MTFRQTAMIGLLVLVAALLWLALVSAPARHILQSGGIVVAVLIPLIARRRASNCWYRLARRGHDQRSLTTGEPQSH